MAKKKNRKPCEKCGASVNIDNYSQHMSNAHGLNSRTGSSRNKIVIISTLLIVALIAVAWNFTSTSEVKQITSTPVTSENSDNSARTEEAAVKIPILEIGTSAKWYTYNSNGETTKYFLVKGSDGKTHLAIDACDVCYSSKLGYEQTDNVMTCNNCGQTFPINSIGTENLSGGCWPSYLPYEVDGENVIISESELDQKLFMFQ
ncbi:MAG: DUF2318 domain-containing protein [Candidatus Bathyarchaeia archaeon]